MHKHDFNKNFIPEILSPAGDYEAVRAAVLNGADAVYLGGTDFSARQNAKNFENDELAKAVAYCHLKGVLVYLTLNTLVFDGQMKAFLQALKTACDIGIDALILQDLGMAALARQCCPDMPLHASTQMSVHTVSGAKLLKELGFSRVVLARELSKEAIKQIVAEVDIETEVFVHGALCMSMSGQCYISGIIGGRSGNRGSCAGTCRLPFSVSAPNSSAPEKNAYDLSLKDLCLAKHCGELVELGKPSELAKLNKIGVTSFKIEGRMKRPEYVAAATRVYSNAVRGLEFLQYEEGLQAVFSRSGFTDGYFLDKRTIDMFGFRQKEDVTALTQGLLSELQNTYHKEKGNIPLDMELAVSSSEKTRLFVRDCDNNTAEVFGDIPEKAINRALTCEVCENSLKKLGGTVFIPGTVSVAVGDGLSLSASSLNELRRRACEEITGKRSAPKAVVFMEYENKAVGQIEPRTVKSRGELSTRARFQAFSQLEAVKQKRLIENGRLASFSLPLYEVEKHCGELLEYKEILAIEPDRSMLSTESEGDIIKRLSALKAKGFVKISANNLAHIQIGKELGFIIEGGVFLNCVNSLSTKVLSELSVCSQTLSFEASFSELRGVSGGENAKMPLGIITYGYLPLMLFSVCPIKVRLGCKNCSRSAVDRMSKSFPIICQREQGGNNISGYSELLNCQPLYMADRLDEAEALGLDFQVLYFTVENAEQCRSVFEAYRNKIPPQQLLQLGEFTRGLYYRKI